LLDRRTFAPLLGEDARRRDEHIGREALGLDDLCVVEALELDGQIDLVAIDGLHLHGAHELLTIEAALARVVGRSISDSGRSGRLLLGRFGAITTDQHGRRGGLFELLFGRLCRWLFGRLRGFGLLDLEERIS
jgi:hypothetical protein